MTSSSHPGSGKVTAAYAAVAKHYGVQVKPCPPRRGNRKGVVEKANHTAAQRWWRTLPQHHRRHRQALPSTSSLRPPPRTRRSRVDADGNRCSGLLIFAAKEQLGAVPVVAFPAETWPCRGRAAAQALVSYRGNRYSVPPELAGRQLTVTRRLGSPVLTFATDRGVVVTVHHRITDGTGATVRAEQHVTALNTAALAAFTTARPHRRKQRVPPSPAALAAADVLRGNPPTSPVVDADRLRRRRGDPEGPCR